MGAKNNHDTEELKKQITELYENGKSVKELAGEYGLIEQTIHRWKKHYGVISKTEEGETVTQADVKAMQRRISELKRNPITKIQSINRPRHKSATMNWIQKFLTFITTAKNAMELQRFSRLFVMKARRRVSRGARYGWRH